MMPELQSIRFFAAKGRTSYSMKRGSFRIRNRISGKKEFRISDGRLLDEKGVVCGTFSVSEDGDARRISFHPDDPELNRFFLRIKTSQNEHYYGCGETFSEFDLSGQHVRVWVAEHQNSDRIGKKLIRWKLFGPSPERIGRFSGYETYYAQPTFTSSGRWYLHADTSEYLEFDFTEPGFIGIELHEAADILIGSAESFEELSQRLSERLGRMRVLPEWTREGMILGIQRGPEEIEKKLAKCREHGVRVSGVWSQDWCGCRITGFGYQVMWNWRADDSLYPDLKDRIAKWREQGIRFLGYINPFLAIEKELYREAAEKGYCVKDREGKDYLVKITTFPAAMIDFTNPDAYEWYKNIIKKNMIGIGMAGWMADFGEYLPTDAVLYNGESAESWHNRWPAVWAAMNREALEETGKLGEVFFFTRAGFTDTIRSTTLMWNGDQHVDWSLDDGLASVIPATLSLAMSGCGVAHSDVGGYTTVMQMTRSKELFMRWAEMNAFSPLMRSHEGNQPARNVQFDGDDEMLDHLAVCTQLHCGLAPYLNSLFREQQERGIPVMRPLFYHYDQPEAYKEKYEYLLGRDMLVAPVLTEGVVTREVWLPDDEWVHYITGKEYKGGRHTVDAPLGTPPVFIRKKGELKYGR